MRGGAVEEKKEFIHPELQGGEVFLGNVPDEIFWDDNKIGWRTRRKGEIAYNSKNQPMKKDKLFPVFVKREELEQAGVKTDGEYNVFDLKKY